jgi:hypothetical protein
MNDVAFLFDVSPGPACAIPEDKKIFRVTAEYATAASHEVPATWFVDSEPESDGSLKGPQLPVPHMYSA